jgi:hypothetical protein
MASSINAATSGGGGIITTADATGNLNIQSGGSTVVAVTSTGVAVTGTLSATGLINTAIGAAIVAGSNSNPPLAASATRGIMHTAGSTDTIVSWGTATAHNGYIYGSSTQTQFLSVPDAMHFTVASSTRATLSSTGLAVTGLVDISAATSGQIKFPATQNASANANTLDDYEEGTWTPTDGSGAGRTFTDITSKYTKIGRQLTISAYFVTAVSANGLGVVIGGLPFTSLASTAQAGTYSSSGGTAGIAVLGASTTNLNIVTTANYNTGITNAQMSFCGVAISLTYFI